jgi:hypothetical protein
LAKTPKKTTKIVADGLHTAKQQQKNPHVGEISEGESACGVKNECTELLYSVQHNGYNLIGVTTVERGDGNYSMTVLVYFYT